MSLHRAVLVCILIVTAACGAGDRELREPASDQTTTTRPPIDVGEDPDPGTEAPPAFELTTSAFSPNTMIPERHTCLGVDTSPPLSWANVPDSTAELALVVRDLSADGFVHWVVSGIDPALGGLEEDEVPADAVEARNDFGDVGWSGPCPPAGGGSHDYELRLYALAEEIGLVPGLDPQQAVEHIETSPGYGMATLRGTATG
jgi:Raf kinase inhibitor-like YbhB/YbcL family protein